MPAIVVEHACAKRYAIPADEVRRGDINVPGLIVLAIRVLCCASQSNDAALSSIPEMYLDIEYTNLLLMEIRYESETENPG